MLREVCLGYLGDRRADGSSLVVVADTFSLPGALPLLMSIPFCLLQTSYTPGWCIDAVTAHPLGQVLHDVSDLPAALDILQQVHLAHKGV